MGDLQACMLDRRWEVCETQIWNNNPLQKRSVIVYHKNIELQKGCVIVYHKNIESYQLIDFSHESILSTIDIYRVEYLFIYITGCQS